MTDSDLQQRFNTQMGQLLGPDFPTDISLAVSGGGDSMAMLTLAHNWTHHFGVRLWVVTVDHGLRRDSAHEAAMVATECARLGWHHATLRWHWDGKGNLQDAARDARLHRIDKWRGGLRHVLMGHTRDDLAETFLMRLKRGSGVEGLSAMAPRRKVVLDPAAGPTLAADDVTQTLRPPQPATRRAGFWVIRPLLQERRTDLRHYLRTLQVPYVDDPSNSDTRFDRVRIRNLLAALETAGLGTATLAATAERMSLARDALQARAKDVADKTTQRDWTLGIVRLNRDAFHQIETDTQRRVLANALQWVSSDHYRPRLSALADLLTRALAGGGGTLHGCEMMVARDHIIVFREYQAVAALTGRVGQTRRWDSRWDIAESALRGHDIRPLGDAGWLQLPEKPADGPIHRIARSLPAIWDGSRLVACPGVLAQHAGAFRLRPVAGQPEDQSS